MKVLIAGVALIGVVACTKNGSGNKAEVSGAEAKKKEVISCYRSSDSTTFDEYTVEIYPEGNHAAVNDSEVVSYLENVSSGSHYLGRLKDGPVGSTISLFFREELMTAELKYPFSDGEETEQMKCKYVEKADTEIVELFNPATAAILYCGLDYEGDDYAVTIDLDAKKASFFDNDTNTVIPQIASKDAKKQLFASPAGSEDPLSVEFDRSKMQVSLTLEMEDGLQTLKGKCSPTSNGIDE